MAPSTMTTSTAAAYEAALHRQASLNKPLPRIPSATRRDWLDLAEDDMSASTPPQNMLSVYQFVPHEDGHISVVKTRGNDAVGRSRNYNSRSAS